MNRLLFNLTLIAIRARRILCWFGVHHWSPLFSETEQFCPRCGAWRDRRAARY